MAVRALMVPGLIDSGPVQRASRGGRIVFDREPSVDPRRIVQLLQREPTVYRLDGTDKLRVARELPDVEDRVRALSGLLADLDSRDAA